MKIILLLLALITPSFAGEYVNGEYVTIPSIKMNLKNANEFAAVSLLYRAHAEYTICYGNGYCYSDWLELMPAYQVASTNGEFKLPRLNLWVSPYCINTGTCRVFVELQGYFTTGHDGFMGKVYLTDALHQDLERQIFDSFLMFNGKNVSFRIKPDGNGEIVIEN